MNWKKKAAIQNAIAMLPSGLSYAVYYRVQRRFGGLRNVNPVDKLAAAVETIRRIRELGRTTAGKTFFDLGTGRMLLRPMAYWLMGGGRTITLDLHPYLRAELVAGNLAYFAGHEGEIRSLFGPLLVENRFDELLRFARSSPFSLDGLLRLCEVEYIAPADAARTGFPGGCIDFHTSYTVLEHIPPDTLRNILREGNRIVRPGGLFVHLVDYSDHFSHNDAGIPSINFLQFSDRRWSRYAGNRYMYMNRLRHDDYLDLFRSVGHQVREVRPDVDPRVRGVLAGGGLQLDAAFRTKSADVLEIIASLWITENRSE